MELSLLPYQQQQQQLSSSFHESLCFFTPTIRKRPTNRNSLMVPCRCSSDVPPTTPASPLHSQGRRPLMGFCLTAAAGVYICDVAGAVSTSRRALRSAKIPENEFTTLPNGLKYYDLKVGGGVKAVKGSRVAVRLWPS